MPRAFRLEAMGYREMDQQVWLPEVGLGLRLWQGSYEGHDNTWLRWVDEQSQPIATGAERVDQERQRADEECRRADKLAEQLRRHGIDPES